MYTVQRYRKVVFGIACVLLALATIYVLRPFWNAIAWGTALSILVYPLHSWFSRRLNRSIAALATTVAALFFIVGPLLLVGLLLFGEVNAFVAELRAGEGGQGGFSFAKVVDDADEFVRPYARGIGFTNFDLKEVVRGVFESFKVSPREVFARLFNGVLTFSFALILLFFLLRDGHKLRKPAFDLIPLSETQSQDVLDSVYDMVHATFYGIVLVALAQGTLAGLAFLLLGVQGALLLGLATVALCTIPFVGAPVLWVPIAMMMAYQGQWGKAIVLTLIGVFVIGLIDNIFRPIIIGARVKVHPVAVFFSLIGGVLTLGPVGILAGPVLLILSLGAIQILRQVAVTAEPAGEPPPDARAATHQ